jgi:hypothetical protein
MGLYRGRRHTNSESSRVGTVTYDFLRTQLAAAALGMALRFSITLADAAARWLISFAKEKMRKRAESPRDDERDG